MDELTREKIEQDVIEEKMQEDLDKQKIANGYEKCTVCDMWVEDTVNGVCDSCIDDILDNISVEDTIEYAESLNDEYTLLTEYLFNEQQITEVLKEITKADNAQLSFRKGIKEYLENDIYDLLVYLKQNNKL